MYPRVSLTHEPAPRRMPTGTPPDGGEQRAGTSGWAPDDSLVLYARGEPSDTFTLILQGKVLIRTGAPALPAPTASPPSLSYNLRRRHPRGAHQRCSAGRMLHDPHARSPAEGSDHSAACHRKARSDMSGAVDIGPVSLPAASVRIHSWASFGGARTAASRARIRSLVPTERGGVPPAAGSEGFELELGPWSVLGNRALSVDTYHVCLGSPHAEGGLARLTRPAQRWSVSDASLLGRWPVPWTPSVPAGQPKMSGADQPCHAPRTPRCMRPSPAMPFRHEDWVFKAGLVLLSLTAVAVLARAPPAGL